MLRLIISSLLLLLFACNSTQNAMDGNAEKSTKCPPEVECSAELLSNKTMVLKEDTIGQLYIQLEDKQGSHVIKHAYIKESRPGLADDGYSEIVYFEITDETTSLDIGGEQLKQHKLIVQKGCFCPDAGNELVSDGNIKLKQTKKGYDISISINTERQLRLKELNFTVVD